MIGLLFAARCNTAEAHRVNDSTVETVMNPTDIAIYQAEGGAVEVRLGRESVWLN